MASKDTPSIHVESHYFQQGVYFIIFAFIALVLLVSMLSAYLGWQTAATILNVSAALLTVMILMFGRVRFVVDESHLRVQLGWLGLRWAFSKECISCMRVVMFKPDMRSLCFGLKFSRGVVTCLCATQERGLRFTYGGHRFILGSNNPQLLKSAIAGDERIEAEQQLAVESKRKFRARRAVRSNWSILTPQDIESHSRVQHP